MLIGAARRHALSLPETTEAPHHHYASFRVRGKIFVTVPPDGLHIHVFVGEEDRERAIALFPEYVEKLLWGARVPGVRITLPPASTKVVKELISAAWRNKAPPGTPRS